MNQTAVVGVRAVQPGGGAVKLGGRLCLFAFVTVLFLLSGSYDPDFEAYRIVYEFGLRSFGDVARDPGFTFLTENIGSVLAYEQFRYALCALFGLTLFKLATRLGKMSTEGFGLTQALFLAPFILLKFHVQIREGLALLIWLFAVTANGGVMSRNLRSWPFWILAPLSFAVHFSTVMWWAAALVLGSKRPKYWLQAFMVFLLFACYGAMTTRAGSELIAATYGDVPFFTESEFDISVRAEKIWYWTAFIVLPLLTLLMFNRSALSLRGESPWQPSVLGLTGTYGLIGFFGVSMLGTFLWGASETDFNLTMRVAITLLMFLAIQLSLTRQRWAWTWLVFSSSFLVVARLLFYLS
jgi:hypothetical protein